LGPSAPVEFRQEEKSLLESRTTIGRKLSLTGAFAIFPAIVPALPAWWDFRGEKWLAAVAADSLAGFQVAAG
jgi:hypothetical protein